VRARARPKKSAKCARAPEQLFMTSCVFHPQIVAKALIFWCFYDFSEISKKIKKF